SRPVVESFLKIEGLDPEEFSRRPSFEDLTSIDPEPRLTLEYPGCPDACRLVDLFCPIGRGQRGLIVSPPKAGKTTLLKDLATSILKNHPDVFVVMLLVDERPEEVTDFKRTFYGKALKRDAVAEAAAAAPTPDDADLATRVRNMDLEGRELTEWAERTWIIASSNDHDVSRHVGVSTMAIERCKRMVEAGRDVVVVLDSLTRLGRAFNRSNKHANSGRTLSGGIDSKALDVPKQLFGAARNVEEGGSLTIIATCLVDTGSQGDQVIFEEFKGTGNMELVLDRKVAERRLFPAINLAASGTRKEHLLMEERELATITALRRRLMNMPPHQQIEQLLAAMKRFDSNAKLVGSAG
ncbi:MAG: hypothetical protein AAF747_11020, partial [Planctomycetota bacterium]